MTRLDRWAGLTLLVVACSPTRDPAATVTVTPPASAPTPATSDDASAPTPAATTTAATPDVLADDAPLHAGLVRFDGMARPTKGGIDVRGVVLSFEALTKALGAEAPGYDALLGAKLRVTAELVKRDAAEDPRDTRIQRRSGPGWHSERLVSAELLAEPVMIEGEVGRSKGLLTVGEHMVSREDLAWLREGEEPVGQRVRLWGQPRTYDCPPQAQCLVGGSIPMFDVARGELTK